jgi:glutathione S-transferase
MTRLSLADVRFHCLYRFFSAADVEQAADPGLAHLRGYIERLAARTTQPDGARSAKL